jgi:DNA-binding XRE family transcriptional regulator
MRRYSGGDGGDVEEAQHACLVDCARVVWAAMDTSHAPESFRGLLLRHRGRTGLTQRDFATRAGVLRNSVQDWESGLSYPTAERLQRLIRALLEGAA